MIFRRGYDYDKFVDKNIFISKALGEYEIITHHLIGIWASLWFK